MKITQITAYVIEKNTGDRFYNRYCRIEWQNSIYWLKGLASREVSEIGPGALKSTLEEDFLATNGVMHEQLSLFNG